MTPDKTGSEEATVAARTVESERRPGLRAIGAAASRLAAPIVARSGGSMLARLKADWAAIVGAESAAMTWPVALGRDGVLKMHVAPGQALEIQHRTPLFIERINLFFGRDAVVRIVLVQGPLPLPPAPRPAPPLPLTDHEARALESRLAMVSDLELRAALARLGRSIAIASRRDG